VFCEVHKPYYVKCLDTYYDHKYKLIKKLSNYYKTGRNKDAPRSSKPSSSFPWMLNLSSQLGTGIFCRHKQLIGLRVKLKPVFWTLCWDKCTMGQTWWGGAT